MKFNYTFLLRPVVLCLAVMMWLVLQTNLAHAQSRANVTPVKSGGAAVSASRRVPVQRLSATDIDVSPTSLADTLNTGKQRTQQVVVQNTGTNDLVFSAGSIPGYAAPDKISRVVVVTEGTSLTGQIPLIFEAPDIELSFLPLSELPGLTLSDLEPYDVVLLTNDYPFERVSGASGVHIGDVLADYVDAGGKVIMNNNSFAADGLGIGGRFATEQYSPVLPTNESVATPGWLSTVTRPGHPYLQGVSGLAYEYGVRDLTLAPGAIDIAYYSSGALLLATTPNVAAINLSLLQTNHNNHVPWSGDVGVLYKNIVRYFRAASAMIVSPAHGTITPGNQATLDVTFDATGLVAGTYTADLQVYSNAVDSLVAIPLTLVVTGNEVLFQPDTVKAALHKAETAIRKLAITNNGTVSQSYTVTGVPAFATVSPLSGSLAVGATDTLTVIFSSTGLEYGTYTGNITVDVNGTPWPAPVSLYVYDNPELLLTTTSLHDTVAYNGESVQTFVLENTGGSNLTYSIQFVDNAPAVSQSFVAAVPLLKEDFEGPVFPPAGWSNPAANNRAWNWSTEYIINNVDYYGNYAGTGRAAMVSEINGSLPTDASLITPPISTEGFRHFQVDYNANFQENPLDDSLVLDIQVDNGAWQQVLSWAWDNNGTHGGYFSLPGEHVSLSLDDYVDTTAASFRLRWRYIMRTAMEAYVYAQIDDVVVSGERRQWLNVVPETGTVPPGGSVTLTANFDAEGLASGLYTGEVQISSNDPQQAVVSIPASLYVEEPTLHLSETSIIETITVGDTLVRSLVLTNNGAVPLSYDFSQTSLGTTPSAETVLYATDFNNFALGSVTNQNGWNDLYGTSEIVAEPVGNGKRLLVQMSGMSLAWVQSPTVPVGNHDLSSLRMDLTLVGTPIFGVSAIDGTTGMSPAGIRYDGNTDALTLYAYDSTINDFNEFTVPMPAHAATFNLRIDVERSTQRFTVYIDGVTVFTGRGQQGEVQRAHIVLEYPGLYVDNFAILNGVSPEYSKSISPLSGTIQPEQSATVTLTYASANTLPGVYRDTVILVSNPPAIVTRIPVQITVVEDTTALQAKILPSQRVEDEVPRVRFSLYPVPVADEFHVGVPEQESGRVRVIIMDRVGCTLYIDEGNAVDFRDHILNAHDAGLTTGFYYLRVEYSIGKQEVRKFMKQ